MSNRNRGRRRIQDQRQKIPLNLRRRCLSRNKKLTEPNWHIKTKTLNIQNREEMLKAARKKDPVTYKGRPIRITPDFSMKT